MPEVHVCGVGDLAHDCRCSVGVDHGPVVCMAPYESTPRSGGSES